jgi:glycosyltransferase involved in cell wall biosynthesis
MTPRLSLIVVAYDMSLQLARTLLSLSPAMQQRIAATDYELIVVDNGSPEPIVPATAEDCGVAVRWLRIDDAAASPAGAVNRGLRLAAAPVVGVMVDGARMASPGLLRHALAAARLADRPVIGTLGFHLGPDLQQRSIWNGYDEAAEEQLLLDAGWQRDGYRLFDISVFAASSAEGWFAPPAESNALFMPAEMWDELGGYDEGFRSAGGGYVNLDAFERACALPGAELIMLLGEGTFHQVHGGVSTNSRNPPAIAWQEEYERLRGRPFRKPAIRPTLLGNPPRGPRTAQEQAVCGL